MIEYVKSYEFYQCFAFGDWQLSDMPFHDIEFSMVVEFTCYCFIFMVFTLLMTLDLCSIPPIEFPSLNPIFPKTMTLSP
jgi:hypothetical protein